MIPLFPMATEQLTPRVIELSDSDLQTPNILKDKILMAPGLWNGKNYTAEEIRKAFERTDWANRDSFGPNALIADHSDKPLKVNDWFGYVKNAHMDGENLIGDLELYDDSMIMKLVKGKAKFGISPRLMGEADGDFMKDFIFENFSIVTNPACKAAYINLSEQKESLLLSNKLKEVNKMSDQVTEDKKSVEEVESEKMKEEPKVEEEVEMSDEQLLEVATLAGWPEFVAAARKKDPKMPMKAIAKAFKGKSEEMSKLEELSEEEIVSRIEKLAAILKNKKPQVNVSISDQATLGKIDALTTQVAELSERLNTPAPKSVQTSTTEELSLQIDPSSHYSPGVNGMAAYLGKLISK